MFVNLEDELALPLRCSPRYDFVFLIYAPCFCLRVLPVFFVTQFPLHAFVTDFLGGVGGSNGRALSVLGTGLDGPSALAARCSSLRPVISLWC